MKYRLPLTCLGVTPGMRISNAKSDESIGITGLVVPRHSLENDLVVSLNLKKEDNFNILEHNGILTGHGKREKKEFYDFKTKYCRLRHNEKM